MWEYEKVNARIACSHVCNVNTKQTKCAPTNAHTYIHTYIHIYIYIYIYIHIYTETCTYINALEQIDRIIVKRTFDEKSCNETLYDQYRSAFDGMVWTVLTRPNAIIYAQNLQCRNAEPKIIDCQRCNLIVNRFKESPLNTKNVRIQHTLRIVNVTDATFNAFVAEEIWFRAGKFGNNNYAI